MNRAETSAAEQTAAEALIAWAQLRSCNKRVRRVTPLWPETLQAPGHKGTPLGQPRTEKLFARACADCHSHQTRWPWYSHVAPVSWYIANHVEDGRKPFNMIRNRFSGGTGPRSSKPS